MFDSELIRQLNTLEMSVFEYILEHSNLVLHMTVRELATKCHVSTSTVLRCCNKLGLSGFSELKYLLKHNISDTINSFDQFYDDTVQVDLFLKKVNQESYEKLLEPAVHMIVEAHHIAFMGLGTSGFLGGYGSRYFMNLGFNAYHIPDPFAPVPARSLTTTLAIVLSVSGETTEVIEKVERLNQYGAKVLSITNQENSTISRMADYNISYYMPEVVSGKKNDINLTTQIPVVALLEILARRSFEMTQADIEIMKK